MDQNVNSPRPQDYAMLAVVVGTATFGAYQITKLGADWVREGIQTRKNKKAIQN